MGDSEGQGSLACYSPWGNGVGHELVTEQNNTWKTPQKYTMVNLTVGLSSMDYF